MAKEKELLNRIHVVQVTSKITQAMKMVSVSKLEKIRKKAANLAGYANPLQELFTEVMQYVPVTQWLPYFAQRTKKNTLCIVITSDKGLCGSFNHAILEAVTHYQQSQQKAKKNTDYLPIGKKGLKFLKVNSLHYSDDYVNIGEHIQLHQVALLCQFLANAFLQKTYDEIVVACQTHGLTVQPCIEPLLPLAPIPVCNNLKKGIIYEPNAQQIAKYLLPKILTIQLSKIMLATQATETKSRIVAMSKSTDNANDLLKSLNLKYNRIRQTNITKGIIEITAGSRL